MNLLDEKHVLAIKHNTGISSVLSTDLKIEHQDMENIKCDPDEELKVDVNDLKNVDVRCGNDPLKIDPEVKKEDNDKSLLNLDSKLDIQRSECNYGSLQESITKKSCKICSISFNSESEFDTHMCKVSAVRIEDGPFPCVEASSLSMQCKICKSSCKKHAVENPFQCDVCKQSFSLKSLFDLHMNFHKSRKSRRNINSIEEKRKQCKVCNKEFARMDQLRRHMNDHVFNCKFCTRSFSREYWLKKHEVQHVSEPLCCKVFNKECTCKVCNKQFCESCLTSHEMQHTND